LRLYNVIFWLALRSRVVTPLIPLSNKKSPSENLGIALKSNLIIF
jgi:hypothetical protein